MVLAWTTYGKISMGALGFTTATVLFYCRYMGPLSQNMGPEIMGTSLNIETERKIEIEIKIETIKGRRANSLWTDPTPNGTNRPQGNNFYIRSELLRRALFAHQIYTASE
jgi:hypothetical protein